MLREALHIITTLWSGGFHSFAGKHLQLEDARVYDLPDELPEIIVAASGPNAARIAADYGGMFMTSPDADVVKVHRAQGGSGAIFGETLVSYDPNSKDAGRQAALRSVRWAGLGTVALSEIPRASVFESATQSIQPSDLDSILVAGPDPTDYLRNAETYASAGIDGIVFINGSAQVDKFLEFAAEHLIPAIHSLKVQAPI
jgi:G6PDH family F420-dependent oxidoreductase